MIFPRWRQSLVRSLHVQRSKPETKFFQVANACLPNDSKDVNDIVVHNRTMVFRGFVDNSHTLLAISDSRSDKISQWQQVASTQLCWYFTKTREQFRISAKVILVGSNGVVIGNQDSMENHEESNQEGEQELSKNACLRSEVLKASREALWDNLSGKAREQFFWPTPNEPVQNTINELIEDKVNKEMPDLLLPDNFIMVCFEPYYVDYVNLRSIPQTREIHELIKSKWTFQAVNP